MQATTISNPIKTDQEIIENFHSEMRRQFAELYTAQRPSLKKNQAQERQEAVARIKNVLFANLLIKIIRTNSESGHETPAEIDLQSLLEVM